MKQRQTKWMHVLNFFVHGLVGTLLFIAVALPALILSLIISKLVALGAHGVTVVILSLIEYTILIFDGVAVLIYIGVSSWRELKEMFHE